MSVTDILLAEIAKNISGLSLANHKLQDHIDTTITSIAAGELLKWNGTAWTNNTLAEAGIAAASHVHSSYQPLDADLTAIVGLAGTVGFLKKTAANTWTLDTTTYSPTTHTHNYQPLDADLTAIVGLTITVLR